MARKSNSFAGSIIAVALVIGLAIGAFGIFVLGIPKLATLNPYYALSDWTNSDTTATAVIAKKDNQGRTAKLLSAFYGIDGGLPPVLRFLFCPFAPGKDGMPVVFSHQLDFESVQAGDFRVISQSGTVSNVECTTFSPANDLGELRTVLLGGEFGSISDQPVLVEIMGNVLSADGSVNFKGAKISVVPLEAGPSIALAEVIPEDQSRVGAEATWLPWGGGSGCPKGTKLAIRVTWQGGVTKPGGRDADDEDRKRYTVTFSNEGNLSERVPTALADLGDGDNNHLLCFDFESDAREVRFPAGFLTDPREDLNPETRLPIGR